MPNPIPATFPNNISKIHAYEIAKDHNNGDRPFIRTYWSDDATSTGSGDPGAKAKALIGGGSFQSNQPLPVPPIDLPHSPMPIKLWQGRNLYLVRLHDGYDGMEFDTRAKFGPEDPPIELMPPRKRGRAQLFHTVGVYFVRNDKLVHYSGNSMPEDLTDVPNDGWLGFICDFDDTKRVWRMLFPDAPGVFALPIYLNLYDKVDKRPVWATDHGSHDHILKTEPVADRQGVVVHGGIHPGGIGEYVYGGP